MPNLTVSSNVDTMLGAADNAAIRSSIGLNTTDSPTFANLTLTSPSLTSDAPVTISQTWAGNSNTFFTALKVDVTSSGTSSAASLLLDLQVGGSTYASITRIGGATFAGIVLADASRSAFRDGGVTIGNAGALQWSQSSTAGATRDLFLVRDAANTLALRNAGAPQTFNVYGTSGTNNTDYRRLSLSCPTTGEATIQSQFSTPVTVTGMGSTASTATIFFTTPAAFPTGFPVGSTVSITGITPAGYNGIYTVTASNSVSVTYANTTNAAYTGGGAAVVYGFAGTVSINGVPVGLGKGNISSNVAIGTGSLNANTTGTDNVAVGFQTLNLVSGNYENVAVGYTALKAGGFRHVAIGYGAAQAGQANDGVDIGWAASFSRTSGALNTVVGRNAARTKVNGGVGNLTSFSNCVLIGSDVKAFDNGDTNEIVIGYDATGIGSNSVVLGNDSITKTALKGALHFGTNNGLLPGGTSYGGHLGSSQYFALRSTSAVSTTIYLQNSSSEDKNAIVRILGSGSGADHGALNINTIESSPIIFTTGFSNERMRITAAGNVGIGTTAPSTLLEVTLPATGNVQGQGIKLSRGAGFFTLGNATSLDTFCGDFVGKGSLTGSAISLIFTGIAGSDSDNANPVMAFTSRNSNNNGVIGNSQIAFQFRNYATNLISVLGSGNVGIGTTSPTSKLHVVGDAVLTGQLLGSNYTVGIADSVTQANIAITNNHVGFADSFFVITPKGTGGVIFGPKPDGTATGGNARGIYSVDLQTSAKSGPAQVASGAYSALVGGQANRASGAHSFCGGGNSNTPSGTFSVTCGGQSNIASGNQSFIGGGVGNTANSTNAFIAGGIQGLADRYGIFAHSSGQFATTGDAQTTKAVFRNKTTTNSAVELFLDGASTRYAVTSGKIISMLINITGTKSDGSAVAHYVRQYSIKNIGGTTSQVYAAVTVGTDNAAGTSIAISADDTNDSLKIEVTGVASETWRWVASVDAVEVGHGV